MLEVADRDNSGAIDAAVMADALADADKTINGYIAARYDLPFATAPDLLVLIAAHLARYYLFKDGPTEVVQANYAQALKTLREISTGTVTLEIAGVATSEAQGGVDHSAPTRLFTPTTLADF